MAASAVGNLTEPNVRHGGFSNPSFLMGRHDGVKRKGLVIEKGGAANCPIHGRRPELVMPRAG